MAKGLMIAGAILFVLGTLWHFAPWTLNWFGKLPGDIRVETESGRVFIPITSMIIVSVVLSVLIGLFRR